MEVMFGPHRPLDAIWATRFVPALENLSEEERAEVKARAYQELAGIDI